MPRSIGYGRATGILPLVVLSDGAGDIVDVGPGVTRVKVGDRVCPTFFQNWTGGEPRPENFDRALGGSLDGTMTELMAISEQGVVKPPDTLT